MVLRELLLDTEETRTAIENPGRRAIAVRAAKLFVINDQATGLEAA